jgi:uncharacterized membrane protein
MTAKNVRQKAWTKLQGKWKTLALIWFVFSLIMGAVGFIPGFTYGVGSVVAILLTGPFALSLTIVALNIVRGENVKLEQLFDGFKNFRAAFLLRLLNTIFVFLWSLLLIVPGIVKLYAYKMSFYILCDNPGIEVNEARKQSVKMMNGHKLRLFCLDFSFIGWILLCILTGGILYFWVAPYIEATHAEFYEDLKQQQTS